MIFTKVLKEADWERLSELKGTPVYGVIEKIIDIMVYNASQKALLANVIEEVHYERGVAAGLKALLKEIKSSDKKLEELKKKKGKLQKGGNNASY